jgi:Mce-associated membrane protein
MTHEVSESTEVPEPTDGASVDIEDGPVQSSVRSRRWTRAVVYGVLPAFALVLALCAGFLKWQDSTTREDTSSRIESLQAAKDSTIALLSYQPDTAEQKLNAARDLLTGEFRDSYTQLINDVVIPGAKEKKISAEATVPASASVSADEQHAVALVYVNQRTVIGKDAPSDLTSSIRVSMDKVDGRWLISRFDPV